LFVVAVVVFKESGKVYAFGDNTWGQLGLGHCRPVRKPVRIKGTYILSIGNGNGMEVDLYSAFIVVPHTQGAQVQITQFHLQITPYLPLPRKHSPDGASPD